MNAAIALSCLAAWVSWVETLLNFDRRCGTQRQQTLTLWITRNTPFPARIAYLYMNFTRFLPHAGQWNGRAETVPYFVTFFVVPIGNLCLVMQYAKYPVQLDILRYEQYLTHHLYNLFYSCRYWCYNNNNNQKKQFECKKFHNPVLNKKMSVVAFASQNGLDWSELLP